MHNVVACLQVAETVYTEVQQQEIQHCKRLAAAGLACNPTEQLYADINLHGGGQEAGSDMSPHQLALLTRSLLWKRSLLKP